MTTGIETLRALLHLYEKSNGLTVMNAPGGETVNIGLLGWAQFHHARSMVAQAVPSKQVHVLIITHKHGEDYSVFTSKEGAKASLVSWCTNWWKQEFNIPEPIGLSDDELIERYFAKVEGVEDFHITEVTMNQD